MRRSPGMKAGYLEGRDLAQPGLEQDSTKPKQQGLRCYLIHDPDFAGTLAVATPVKLQAVSVRAIYRDRWPVEQIPLSASRWWELTASSFMPRKAFNACRNWRYWLARS